MDKGTPKDLIKEVEIESSNVQSGSELKLRDKKESLKKMILGMKRANDPFDVCRLSLFPQVHLPLKFKMLERDKFGDTRCPSAHLKMYASIITNGE